MSSKQLAARLLLIHQRVSGLFIKSPHIDWFIFLQGDRYVCSSAGCGAEYRVSPYLCTHLSLERVTARSEHLLASHGVAAAVHSCEMEFDGAVSHNRLNYLPQLAAP